MKRAFTLVEILVVLAIIFVLSALLFGGFSVSRGKARQASCQSNLKQIALATQMYAQDNAGHYPFYFNAEPPGYYNSERPGSTWPNDKPGIGWAVRIGSYLKSNTLLQCPQEPIAASNDPTHPPIPSPAGTPGYTDYGYNRFLSNCLDSRFSFSDRTVSFTDMRPQQAWGIIMDPTGPLEDFDRHFGGGNCAFVDGHVKWMKATDIFLIGPNSEENAICTIDKSPATVCAY
jgi:prepilin-type N-terminal cleavage/methylation domain-containing protein/prepilin-type processing-associated H-X9-DG protein